MKTLDRLFDRPLAQATAMTIAAALIVGGTAMAVSSQAMAYEALQVHHQPTQTAEAK